MSGSLSHRRRPEVAEYGIARDALPAFDAGPIDLRQWFPEPDRPLELEIGSGKGTFLVQHAARHAAVNFLGIEYARAFWRHAADRARRHGLANVRLVHFEAGAFVRHFVPTGAIRQVHVYFPDPWPKKRHHKRRLIQAALLRELHRILEPARDDAPEAGQIRLATDHADYFAWMCEHAEAVADWFERLPYEPPDSAGQGECAGTNFERKYRREGRQVQGMILRRR